MTTARNSIDSIKADRKIGIKGPWEIYDDARFNTLVVMTSGGCHKNDSICQIPYDTIEGDLSASARRIARVPVLEDAVIEQALRIAELEAALAGMVGRYVELVECGDCGHWNAEDELPVQTARAALGGGA